MRLGSGHKGIFFGTYIGIEFHSRGNDGSMELDTIVGRLTLEMMHARQGP